MSLASSTTSTQDRFAVDGVVRISGTGVPEATLTSIVATLRETYPADGSYERDGVSYFDDRIMDAWKINDQVRELALAPGILDLLESLFGRRPRPFQTLTFRKGTQQRIHSDAFHFNSEPAGFLCAVWVALEDVDMDNGPVVYYPGSHRSGEITEPGLPAPAGGSVDYDRYHDFVQQRIDTQRLEPSYGVLAKGEALVWSGNLLHGGLPVADPARSRFSQATHYFFEDCRYWVPKLSGPQAPHFKNPTWVR